MKKRVAVVTGGARGIGEQIVRRLCADGIAAAICYLNSEAEALSLASELSSQGARTAAFRLDVADSVNVDDTVGRICRTLGEPLMLVNNAGIAEQKLFTDITDGDWARMINVNLTGAFYMSRAVLPFMIREKYGRIVNISSMWGQVGASCEVHYSAAKAGLIGMTRALAKEVAPSGITVNCVAPGAVDTAMMKCFSREDIDALCEEIPAGRLAHAYEIAAAVSFLVSDGASYVTGQTLGVNGAMTV